MAYIIESVCSSDNLVTIYYRHNLDGAHELAQFLKDKYGVETEVYTDDDYVRLHPEKFYEHSSDYISESDETKYVGGGFSSAYQQLIDAGVYDEEGHLLSNDPWAY